MTESARLLALLDSAALLGAYGILAIFEDQFGYGVARHALTVWAGARNLPIEEHERLLIVRTGLDDGCQISLHLKDNAPDVAWRPADGFSMLDEAGMD